MKKIFEKIHLWLSVPFGLIITLICFSGAMLVFEDEVNELVKKMQAHQIGADVFEEKLATLMKDYKDEVKTKYIFSAPNTAAAYFALFQKLNNYLIFDPLNNKEEVCELLSSVNPSLTTEWEKIKQ